MDVYVYILEDFFYLCLSSLCFSVSLPNLLCKSISKYPFHTSYYFLLNAYTYLFQPSNLRSKPKDRIAR
jgi:hypothetical protein